MMENNNEQPKPKRRYKKKELKWKTTMSNQNLREGTKKEPKRLHQ
jgi:hypothetical protein